MRAALKAYLRAKLRAWLGVPDDVVVLVVPVTTADSVTVAAREALARHRGELN